MPRTHRVFSALYDSLTACQEYLGFARTRARLVSGLSGRVLEVGVGTGLNLAHYGPQATVIAIEPDPYMLRRAAKRRAAASAGVILLAADGETLPFRAASFDAVVATLVFCTIIDPAAAAREVRRVLRPGGTFHFVEHVRAQSLWLGSLQDAVDPLWSRLFAGCHPGRATLDLLRREGFKINRFTASKRGVVIRGEAIVA
jgi:ubiquinone/menaquinone biosynthesis C-methylase UbiE